MASSQRTHETITEQQRQEEYLDAKRAAVEAVEIGRETLAESARQGEQLQNAERMADQTRFALDKSQRILRGMTWSGWVQNMFSSDVKEEDYLHVQQNKPTEALCVYDDVPEVGQKAAQAIQNMQANLLVLEACETDEQRQMCVQVCDDMYNKATQEVSKLHANGDDTSLRLVKRFLDDLSKLRGRLKACKRRMQQQQTTAYSSDTVHTEKTSPSPASKQTLATKKDPLMSEQDEHLEFISQNMSELTNIAHSLHESFATQGRIVDSLDEKSDEILDKSKAVIRRSDRIIQKKSWTPVKKQFSSFVAIRHVQSGYYIAETTKSLRLATKFGPQTCTFGLWKRQGDIFGLQHKLTGRWIGQTAVVGSLACSSNKFGTREEWQADSDWKETRLLCVSAGWGNGGYLCVKNGNIVIGGGDLDAKKQADLWCIEELESTEAS